MAHLTDFRDLSGLFVLTTNKSWLILSFVGNPLGDSPIISQIRLARGGLPLTVSTITETGRLEIAYD